MPFYYNKYLYRMPFTNDIINIIFPQWKKILIENEWTRKFWLYQNSDYLKLKL